MHDEQREREWKRRERLTDRSSAPLARALEELVADMQAQTGMPRLEADEDWQAGVDVLLEQLVDSSAKLTAMLGTVSSTLAGLAEVARLQGDRLEQLEDRAGRNGMIRPPTVVPGCINCTIAGRACWLHGGVGKVAER